MSDESQTQSAEVDGSAASLGYLNCEVRGAFIASGFMVVCSSVNLLLGGEGFAYGLMLGCGLMFPLVAVWRRRALTEEVRTAVERLYAAKDVALNEGDVALAVAIRDSIDRFRRFGIIR